MSKLWYDGVWTLYSDPSTPRLRCYHCKLIYTSRPTWFYRFLIVIFLPPYYRPPIISRTSSYSYPCLHSLLTSSPGVNLCLPGRCLHPPPSSLCRLSLRPAPCACICRRFPWLCTPPFPVLGMCPGSCQTLGGFYRCGYLCVPCSPASPSLRYPPNPCIF